MDIHSNLKRFSEQCPNKVSKLNEFLIKTDWTTFDRISLLSILSKNILNTKCANILAEHFHGILLDLLHRAVAQIDQPADNLSFSPEKHESFCYALAQLGTEHHSTVFRFAINYFKTHPPPFYRSVEIFHGDDEPASKKRKRDSNHILNEFAIANACYGLVCQSPEDFQKLWNWATFLSYLNNSSAPVKWFASLSIALLFKFTSKQIADFLHGLLSKEKIWNCAIRYGHASLQLPSAKKNFLPAHDENSRISSTLILPSDLVPSVVSVSNILLPRYKECGESDGCLVSTPSTCANLRSLVLAVKKGLPVLLQGPIGSGKTSIVEHLAQLTGRTEQPHLLKVQLGDQTDSKMLLGTYRCTDVPGEFIWQPGTLLQAVQNGYWILLEDIDYAPMDVISLLVPLLETQSLTVPGHSSPVKASLEFHLFATQRLYGSSSGFFKARSSHMDILEKLFTKISVQPLSRDELKEVIIKKWPILTDAVDRIVEVYLLMSAGKHEFSISNCDGIESVVEPLVCPSSGRPVSTRDLLKWCHRMSDSFLTCNEITMSAFQEALDCFCASISKTTNQIAVAKMIAARLNIVDTEAEVYCTTHKPSFRSTARTITVGRCTLPRKSKQTRNKKNRVTFAFTRQASVLLEQLSVTVRNCEPVLIVGETGTGKTATVQYLAAETGHKLVVINMNQHSDSADLLGGFKPVDLRCVIRPLKEQYEDIFTKTFSRSQNSDFLKNISTCFNQRKYKDLLSCMMHTQRMACYRFKKVGPNEVSEDAILLKKWLAIGEKISRLEIQVKHSDNALAFAFTEGTLVKAIKEGSWILLDEINLASAETLDCLGGLLESIHGSVLLLERGDTKTIERHPNFRLFACMNPATDVGKKELPPGLRNRFTEFFMEDLEDRADLRVLVEHYLKGLALTAAQIDGIVRFYLQLRIESETSLTDGTGHKPHYSLRTLCRALSYAAGNPCMSVPRSLYEAFCLSFLTQLDRSSHPVVENLIVKFILEKQNVKGILHKPLPEPTGGRHLNFEGYYILKGDKEPFTPDGYILTQSIRCNLKDLSRVIAAGRHPVLLQGGTSVGKTSLIKWLADSSGNLCIRVNNHEHTDLQEYVGSYAADVTGKLVFKEGVLVDAMRKGYWIILDELNLAPSDVLEALNRVLDDNRELFIPETQETVKAHPRFMLFATQNPPGHYGGRKVLSRAFRNRFVELHFEEIPPKELETILHQRCALPPSYCKKLVAIMMELQTRRSSSGIFAGKQGLITLRDLFRWAERYRLASKQSLKFYDWDQHLADEGYLLLAGRVRKNEESQVIATVIEKHFKCHVNPENLFVIDKVESTSPVVRALVDQIIQISPMPAGFDHLVWTYNMRRLAILIGQALRFNEPVLLVGETGCGKTTICQFFAALSNQPLYSVNCHMHSEGADFLGGLRPVRSRDNEEDSEMNGGRLFEWVDGPLVKAMQDGAIFLADEISLADDSVLERLNSVLEPERTLLLAENISAQGSAESDDLTIIAKESFRFVATMNPGGDYGKKELSPALRNRFTEIWCPSSSKNKDLVHIIEHNVSTGLKLCKQEDGTTGIGHAMLDFLTWFGNQAVGRRLTLSIRDILSWVNFINTTSTCSENSPLDVPASYIHGACLVFLDAIGTGTTNYSSCVQVNAMKKESLNYLLRQVERMTGQCLDEHTFGLHHHGADVKVISNHESFGIEPFLIQQGECASENLDAVFTLRAPTTCMNALRVLRAMQLAKPILLEGSPGVGKTSLVIALAKAAGHNFVRINLSEQTDISDLFGADLPVEGGRGGQFAWHDGPLLRAIKCGDWIVLDELNLASQSVLEGLNACLDHRGEIYVSELGRTFKTPSHKTRRIFACQNPLSQGGARKGLPKSFLNRFIQVFIEPLSSVDLELITSAMYPKIPTELVSKMVAFNQQINSEINVKHLWGTNGGPWEINLRDVFRWCELLIHEQNESNYNPGVYVQLIYGDRMRTLSDREMISKMCQDFFGDSCSKSMCHLLSITSEWFQLGYSVLPRGPSTSGHSADFCLKKCDQLYLLPRQFQNLESLMKCIEMNWMAILVGPASSGKTSMVQLLANLTNHPLQILSMNSDMDTTELLGGFEQADLNRHLAKISEEISGVLHTRIKYLLINEKDHKNVRQLMHAWSNYEAVLEIARKGTTKDEAVHFLKKVSLLKEVIKVLESQLVSFTNQNSLVERLDKLEIVVKRDEAVNCGGRFEWVDSMLVTALQKGYWLLIDNVNFCSPSVLDRLNGLLEPNGVLSISERGVCDGKIPTYVPHPDFRLILAMNPVNGEISRAMRNRGVEIYIGAENEIPCVRLLELKTLLDSVGLHDPSLQMLLITIHDAINSNQVADKSSINDFLRAAQLAVQRMQEGEFISEALYESCLEVYVRCQYIIAKKQKSKGIIEELLMPIRTVKATSELEANNVIAVPSTLMAVNDFTLLPELSKSKQDSAALFAILQLKLNNFSAEKDCLTIFRSFIQTDEFTNVDLISNHVIKAAVDLFMLWGSCSDWPLRISFLNSFSNACKNCFLINDSNGKILEYFDTLIGYGERAARKSFTSEPAKQLQLMLSELFKENELIMAETFYDLRWNSQLLQLLISRRLQISDSTNVMPLLEELFAMSNRCNLLFAFTIWRAWAEDQTQKFLELLKNKQYPKLLSLIQISVAFSKGVKSSYSVPDVLAQHLNSFFKSLFVALENTLSSQGAFSNDHFSEWKRAMLWIQRFWSICSQPITEKTLASSDKTVLYLHWLWLTKKAFPVFFGEMWESDKLIQHSFLWPVYEKLADHFRRHNAHVNAYSTKLYRVVGHPRPFLSQVEAELFLCLKALWLKLNDSSGQNLGDIPMVREQIINILLQEDLLKGRELAADLEEGMKLRESAHALSSSVTDCRAKAKNFNFELQLLPLIEHLTLLQEHMLISHLQSHNVLDEDVSCKLNATRNLADISYSVTPSHLAALEKLSKMENVDNALILEYQFEYFNLAWQFSALETKKALQLEHSGTITSKDNAQKNADMKGPKVLYTPLQNIIAANLLADVCDSESLACSNHLLISTNLPLSQCFEKTVLLRDVSNIIWSNAKSLRSGKYDALMNDCRLILVTFGKFVSSLCAVVEPSIQQTIGGGIYILETIAYDFTKVFSAEPIIEEIMSHLAESKLFTEELLKSWNAIEENLLLLIKSMHTLDSFERRLVFEQVIASTWIHLGWVQTSLLAPIFDADPATRQKLKLEFWQEEKDTISNELLVIDLQMQLTTGRRLSSCEPSNLHPNVLIYQDRIQKAIPKIELLKEDQAYRPIPSQYEALRQKMIQFINTVGSYKNVFHLLEELENSSCSDNVKAGFNVLGKVRVWLASQQAFLRKLSEAYPLYKDLTLPCFVGIQQMMHGMALQVHATEIVIKCTQLAIQPIDLMETVKLLLVFPNILENSSSCFEMSKLLQESAVKTIVSSLFSSPDMEVNSKKHLLRLLKSTLLEFFNHAVTATYLHEVEIQFLDKILQSFVVSWQQQEEERRRKEADDESYYLFKGKEYGEIIDDEEQLMKSIKNTFPTYAEEFSDLTPVHTLEQEPMKNEISNASEAESNSFLTGQITQQEIEDVVVIHHQLFVNYTTCVWHRPDPSLLSPNFVNPLAVRYPIAADILLYFGNILEYSIDASLLNGHLCLSSLYQKVMDSPENKLSSNDIKRKSYDFYHDSYITEAVQCRPILEGFTGRINELLQEWPDHPTLKQVQKIIDRILSFPVTSPLMKFVTGLELLLGQAQEWEKNAHKGISLFIHLEAITKQIIIWRKLELSFWSTYLDYVEARAHQQAAKWWFHVYITTQFWLNPDMTHPEHQQPNETQDALPVENVKTINEICSILQQFMETSPLGEYKGRLDILLAFACHLTHASSSNRQKKIINVLWNLFQYYNQFLSTVLTKIELMRKPIDKNIKNFIKIARWNDINFWAIKEAVEKSHRTLHKHMKQFENGLKQSSHVIFSDEDLLSKKESSEVSSTVFAKAKLSKQTLPSFNKSYFVLDAAVDQSAVLKRLPNLYTKAYKFCKKVLATPSFSMRSIALNEFIGDVISNVHELQSLEVNQKSTKDRQRVEAKNINLRKRRALSDLFRILTDIGLSYRKGQLYFQDENNKDPEFALMPPLDVAAVNEMLGPKNNPSEFEMSLMKDWSDCPHYFYRSVARMSLLQLSLENPSKELGPANLHRCLGFVAHLHHLCIEQRTDLAHLVNNLHNMKSMMQDVSVLQLGSASALLFPPQKDLKQWTVVLFDELARARQGLGQFLVLLQSCPAPSTNPAVNSAVLDPTCNLTDITNVRQGHPWLINAIAAVEACVASLQQIQESLREEKQAFTMDIPSILTWGNAGNIFAAFEKFQAALNSLPSAIFSTEENPFTSLPIQLRQNVRDKMQKFVTWRKILLESRNENTTCDNSNSNANKMHKLASKLANGVLLAIQEVFKKEVTSSVLKKEEIPPKDCEASKEDSKEDECSFDLENGALVIGLHASLKDSLHLLNINCINKMFIKLIQRWRNITNSDSPHCVINQCTKYMLHILPLLKLYTNLLQFYFNSMVKAHRVTCKMTSVLLGVFTELVRKGFCLPAEFSDEAAGDGCTSFEDIEGGGIGEGEGVKDVSNRIENEDQLEEAHQQGSEKEEQDPGKKPDLKDEEEGIEMSDDFTGKLHDLDDESQKDENSNDESEDENELEKQMGDLQGEDSEKLDEKVWGDDDDEDEDDDDSGDEDEKEDEFGPGDGPQEETKMVAKSDNRPGDKPDSDEPEENESLHDENEKQGKINLMDDREFDDRPDPYHDDKNVDGNEPEEMELDEDLKLDDEEDGDGEGEDGKGEESGDDDEEETKDATDQNPEEMMIEDKPKEILEDQTESNEIGNDNESKIDEEMDEKEEGSTDEKKGECENVDDDEEVGLEPEKEDTLDEKAAPSRDKPSDGDTVQPAENNAKDGSSDMVQSAQEGAADEDQATKNDDDQSEETAGIGQSEADASEGHEGKKTSSLSQPQITASEKLKHVKDRPGQTNEKRSLGSKEQPFHKRFRTEDTIDQENGRSHEEEQEDRGKEKNTSDVFQHIEKSDAHHDAQILDAATREQALEEQAVPNKEEEKTEDMAVDDNIELLDEDKDDQTKAAEEKRPLPLNPEKRKLDKDERHGTDISEETEGKMEQGLVDGDIVETMMVERGLETTMHTQIELMSFHDGPPDVEKLRQELEEQLHLWNTLRSSESNMDFSDSKIDMQDALEAWHKYEDVTSQLAQDLCEQLRLILEPSLTAKLKGDYRTGKRLNMRKVIPYVASQFRKDKIWLRRTKPSKREYQIMLAIDDSSSMADNHSKQLAFEALALINKALLLLEAGEVAIASFGETVNLLHHLGEQFSDQAGAAILREFTFQQRKTRIGLVLDNAASMMLESRQRQRGGGPKAMEVAQLLIIVSDGRGIYNEGVETVKKAVRRAIEAGLFIVFVALDNPLNKDSIFDIRVPIFKDPGQLPEIKSYMDDFPFPFYIILRDINSLPAILSDALRQWFELVISTER